MAAITAFVYSNIKKRKMDSSAGISEVSVELQAGDGALTYPTGGIPFDPSLVGLAIYQESFIFAQQVVVDGYVYKYDNVNKKVLIYQSAAQSASPQALAELPNTATPTVDFYALIRGY